MKSRFRRFSLNVTTFSYDSSPRYSTLTLDKLVEFIKGNRFRTDVAKVWGAKNDDAKNRYKNKLLRVLPSGTFVTHKNSKGAEILPRNQDFSVSSGVVQLDYDGLNHKDIKELREKVNSVKHTVVSFTSCSGSGFRVFARVTPHPLTAEEYKAAYDKVVALYPDRDMLDDSVASCHTPCFISHDPEAFFQEGVAIPVGKWSKVLDHVSSDNGYAEWFKVLAALHYEGSVDGHDYQDIALLWSKKGKSWDEAEFYKTWLSLHDDVENPITGAVILKMASENGLDLNNAELTEADNILPKTSRGLKIALDKIGETVRFNTRSQSLERLVEDEEEESDYPMWKSIEYNTWNSEVCLKIYEKFKTSNKEGNLVPLTFRHTEVFDLLNELPDLKVDPFVEWMNTLPGWDGIERIDTFFIDAVGVKDKPHTRLASRRFWVGLVGSQRAIDNAKYKVDWVPILVGPQGAGKSLLAFLIVPQQERKSMLAQGVVLDSLDAKSFVDQVIGRVVVELAEISGSGRMGLNNLKSLITDVEYTKRLAYRRDPQTIEARHVVIGTANPEEFRLPELSNGRRWKVMEVHVPSPQHVIDYMELNRDQLYAEAYHYYKIGETGRMPEYPDEWEIDNTPHQEESIHMIQEYITAFTYPKIGFSISDATQVLGVRPGQIRRVLLKLGFEQGYHYQNKNNKGKHITTRTWLPPQGWEYSDESEDFGDDI